MLSELAESKGEWNQASPISIAVAAAKLNLQYLASLVKSWVHTTLVSLPTANEGKSQPPPDRSLVSMQ